MVIERFRPNVVIDGVDEPFAEYCDRCVVTTIDPHTLEHGKEPIRTLARYRKWDCKTWFGVCIAGSKRRVTTRRWKLEKLVRPPTLAAG